MRKLLHAIYGTFKHDQLFDGRKVYVLLETPAAENHLFVSWASEVA